MKPLATLFTAALLFACLGKPQPALALACGSTYTVEDGDTLYSIGDRCGVSYLVLVSINYELKDPDNIRPGVVIRLEAEVPLNQYTQPVSGPAQNAGLQPGDTYVVRKGDSLSRIAYLYDTTVPELLRVNPQIIGHGVLLPGQVLTMPPFHRHQKGWVGVSALSARRGDDIEVRVVDFPAYANLEFRVGMKGENDDFDYQVIEAKTDARGEARATLEIPFYALRNEVWEIRAVTVDMSPQMRVISPGILIQ